jgi:predicted nucleic acid-binding protein
VILLVRVGQLDLLQRLGSRVVIPEAAVLEIQRKGPADPAVQALAQATWLTVVDPGPIPARIGAFGLGPGESAVLAYALANPGSGAIVDDLAARNAAAALGIAHQGTLGVVLFAKTRGDHFGRPSHRRATSSARHVLVRPDDESSIEPGWRVASRAGAYELVPLGAYGRARTHACRGGGWGRSRARN